MTFDERVVLHRVGRTHLEPKKRGNTKAMKRPGLGFRVQGSGFRVEGLGFRVLGFRLKLRVEGGGLRVEG